MKICVIGTGYVGLVTGACLADVGHTVHCVDKDASRLEPLSRGEIPFYEPDLSAIVLRNYKDKTLYFHSALPEALEKAVVCMIAVGTPPASDGNADMRFVEQAAREIGQYMQSDLIVVDKSTVPVGTTRQVTAWIQEELDKRGATHRFRVASNPEFLKEGTAVIDFTRPDRIVIGTDDAGTIETLREMYAPFNQKQDKIMVMSPASAELTKYAANAMLAARISFMNEMACLCEHVGADINDVRLGIGADERIGRSFLYAGCGYGGSCFPKDVSALISIEEKYGLPADLLHAINEINNRQRHVLAKKVKAHFGDLNGVRVAVWGLSFKPRTDDIRESPAVFFIQDLLAEGAEIHAFCPQGMENAKKLFANHPKVTFASHKYECLKDMDALALLTEWSEFRTPDFDEIGTLLNQRVIFDGRNIFNRKSLEKKGFALYQIGM